MQASNHQKGMLTGCFCFQEPLARADDVQVKSRRNRRRGQTPSSIESESESDDGYGMGKMTQDSKEAGVAATDATNQP
ncbi:hypothetical protein WJX77_010073 [Trebouxia sp. C0004]